MCANPRSTATQSGKLQFGEVVTVVGRKGQWLRIAEWEAVTGWVRDPGMDGLAPAPDVPMELVHLRARAARTEVLSWCDATDLRLLAPLPGLDLGGVRADTVYNHQWGVEARAEAGASGALAPPGRAWQVYAARDFNQGDTVEACELLSAKSQASCQPNSILWSRTLCPWKGSREAALPLGFGALYRRTMGTPEEPNLDPLLQATESWVSGASTQPRLLLCARRFIKAGEELTTSGDFLGVQGGLSWSEADGSPVPSEGHPLPAPCGARGARGRPQVRASPVHGRGVFADRGYSRGDVLELCPALVLDGPSLSMFADYAMSFDRPPPPAARAPRVGPGDWDPLADPAAGAGGGEEAEGPAEGQTSFAMKEPSRKSLAEVTEEAAAGDWDPLAEPLAETLPGGVARVKPAAPQAAVLSADWSDPFSDPAGSDSPAVLPEQPVVPRDRPAAAPLPPAPAAPALSALPVPSDARIDDGELCALPLGSGALYNHAARGEGRNVRWALAASRGVVVMMATRRIQPGEELFINYGSEYWAGR